MNILACHIPKHRFLGKLSTVLFRTVSQFSFKLFVVRSTVLNKTVHKAYAKGMSDIFEGFLTAIVRS